MNITRRGYLSEAIRKDRDRTGVPYQTLYTIACQARQLSQDGLSDGQIKKAIQNLHPVVMANLSLNSDGSVRLKNPKYAWERRQGWRRR